MSKRKKQLEEFFNAYEGHFNNLIAGDQNVHENVTNAFAECFIESSTLGLTCGKNDKAFTEKIKQGFDFYKSIGSQGMNIVSKDISLLDDFHAIVKIYWSCSYAKDGQEGTIDFNTYYLVNTVNAEPKIFAYMAGDEQKVLREKGLIQEPEEEVSR